MAKILIVEDEALVAADMEDCLLARGHDVVGVADCAEDALDICRTRSPDLAILDVRIRGAMDGIQLSAQLGVPFLFLTAHADTATVERALENAPYGYVVKPFREQELEASVETALTRVARDRRVREVQQILATTLGSLGEGVIACDEQLRISYINSAGCELTGWEEADAIQRPLGEVLRLEFEDGAQPEAARFAERALREQTSIRLDDDAYLMRRGVSIGLPLACCASPLTLEAGDAKLGVVVVFRDRSPEVQVVRQKLELENRLMQAQRLEGLGVLAGGMAHRFNNLLASMMANVTLCKVEPEQAVAEGWLDEVLELGERGASLCRQMLAYGGRAPASTSSVNINHFLMEAMELLTASIPKSVRLTLELDDEVSEVEIDSSQLQQVLTNLVINAAEALGQQHGSVVLRTRVKKLSARQLRQLARPHAEKAGRFLVLEVADTGGGMPPEVTRRAFEPFFSTRHDGSGLGLAAVEGIVRTHSGCVDITSTPGEGTVIRVYLPIPAGEPLHSTRPAPVSERRPCVLLVCDNPSVRSALTVIVSDMGCAVESVGSLEEAREALVARHGLFSVVLVDTSAKQLGEANALADLRGTAPEAQLGVLSGYQEAFARHHFGNAGVSFYIRKPFSRDIVRERLGAVIPVASADGAYS